MNFIDSRLESPVTPRALETGQRALFCEYRKLGEKEFKEGFFNADLLTPGTVFKIDDLDELVKKMAFVVDLPNVPKLPRVTNFLDPERVINQSALRYNFFGRKENDTATVLFPSTVKLLVHRLGSDEDLLSLMVLTKIYSTGKSNYALLKTRFTIFPTSLTKEPNSHIVLHIVSEVRVQKGVSTIEGLVSSSRDKWAEALRNLR